MIDGPIEMMPTYIIFFTSLVLSFFLIILSENKKTHNHRKSVLVIVCMAVSILSIISAYMLNLANYKGVPLLTALQNNMLSAINNIMDFGFLIILASVIFGFLVGSDKNLRTTYTYKSSKHTSSSMTYGKYTKKK